MGRKHTWARKHLPFYITCLMLSILSSCTQVKEVVRVEEVIRIEKEYPHSDFLGSLSGKGAFEAAEKRSLDILERSPKKPPADEALFNLGLIFAHRSNPGKDYRKSLSYFRRVSKEFPESRLSVEAEMWTGVLEDIIKALQVDIEIEGKKKDLSK